MGPVASVFGLIELGHELPQNSLVIAEHVQGLSGQHSRLFKTTTRKIFHVISGSEIAKVFTIFV